jgi:hypothetical protein
MSEFKDTLAHSQLAANQEKLGGWDNAMSAADAIEAGDQRKIEQVKSEYPQASTLIDRIVTVTNAHK